MILSQQDPIKNPVPKQSPFNKKQYSCKICIISDVYEVLLLETLMLPVVIMNA